MRKSFVVSLLITFLVACSPSATMPTPTADEARQILFSPNGQLVAKRYDYGRPPIEKPVIEISDKNGKLLWQIPYQGEKLQGDPGTSLAIYGWANDSSALYFYYYRYPDGGDFAFWWDGSDLQRIDIKTGEIRHLLPGEGSMAFAISPDGTQIAYTRAQDTPGILFLRNLANNHDTRISVQPEQEYTRVGDIHWSPSGKALLFHTEAEPKTNWIQVQVIYLDAVTLQQKVVKYYDLESMWFEGWVGEHTLQFRGLRNEPIFLIDIITNETTIIGTATPSP